MNNLFNPKALIRVFVAIMISNGVVNAFQLGGAMKLIVFIIAYFVVSQIFFYAVDPLMDDAKKKQEEEANNTIEIEPEGQETLLDEDEFEEDEEDLKPKVETNTAWSAFSPYFLLSLTDTISGLPRASLDGQTCFAPIPNEERQVPYYQAKTNQIFVTEDVFFKWAYNLEGVYQVELSKNLLYSWVQGENLQEIHSWLDENGSGPEETVH